MSRQHAIAAEGRTLTGRPSLCLLSIAIALMVFAPLARATPLKELSVHGTNPPSSLAEPASSTTLRVFGSEEEIIKSVVRFGSGHPITAAGGDPSNVVSLFTNSLCEKGTALATGPLSEFETQGIQVEVAPDSETTFYASQAELSEPENVSPCSQQGITYYESSTVVEEPAGGGGGGGGGGSGNPGGGQPGAPANAPVAPRLHALPAGRANNNSPRLTGSAAGAERVKIFTNSSCAGSPVANVSASELATGVPIHVDDNTTTDFAGVSVAGSKQSFCSPPATYIEDSNPPHVRITMAPGAKTRRHKAVFRFADISEEPAGTSFSCRVDHGKWKACHSPFKVKHLHFRRYVLSIRAKDEVGNTSAKPARRSFKVIH